MKNLKTKIASVALSAIVAFASGQVLAKDSSKPIVIPTHNWSSQVVMAYVIGGIFESMGNNVKYVSADTQAVYESIRNGDVTISHEVWQSTFGKSFYNAMAKGGLIDAGTHDAMTLEEMGWAPTAGLSAEAIAVKAAQSPKGLLKKHRKTLSKIKLRNA